MSSMKRDALAKLRAICRRLPDSREEAAWVGRRWKIRARTYAHVLDIEDGWPPAYARAAGTDGPATVLTFRAGGMLYDTLRTTGAPFFHPAWGTLWGTKVIGMIVDDNTDWEEVGVVLAESYRLLAPKVVTRPRRAARAAYPRSRSTRTARPSRRGARRA
jgi:hypothetical protein